MKELLKGESDLLPPFASLWSAIFNFKIIATTSFPYTLNTCEHVSTLPNHVILMTFASSNDDMMSAFILLFLLLVCVTRNQNIYLNCSTNEKIPLRLVGFFPCLDRWSSREPVGNCDKLPLTAVEYVISLINQDTDLLKCFRIELFPITIQNPQQVSAVYCQFIEFELSTSKMHA